MGAAHSVPIDSVLGRPHPKLGEGNWSRFMMKGPHAGKKKKSPVSEWATRLGRVS